MIADNDGEGSRGLIINSFPEKVLGGGEVLLTFVCSAENREGARWDLGRAGHTRKDTGISEARGGRVIWTAT